MLTKITASGYKSLQETTARFTPFTVIVGRNNVGKSNLFDALRLLSHLAQMSATSAFKPELNRGDLVESFFARPFSADVEQRIKIECEIDLSGVAHPFNSERSLAYPMLRYEIELGILNFSMMVVWETLIGRSLESEERRFISRASRDNSKLLVDEDTAKGGRSRPFSVPSARSILTTIDDAELYPHIVALARELRSWRFFHFEPEALRKPSPPLGDLEIDSSGEGLSGFYSTLENLEPERFKLAQYALRRGIPEARSIRILNAGDGWPLLALERNDGRVFTARVLSDGTLRFLALLALAYTPQPPGLVYFEEPENGVHPGRLPFIVDTLRGLSQRGSEGGPRSQVLVNSHSPYLVDLLDPAEMLIASLGQKSQTLFASVAEDLFINRPAIKKILENGEQTLGELWSQGGLDANA